MILNNDDLLKIIKWLGHAKKDQPLSTIDETSDNGVRKIELLWNDNTFIRIAYPTINGSVAFEVTKDWNVDSGVVSKHDLENFMNQINKDLNLMENGKEKK